MATTITTQSTTIKRIVHDPARNRVLLISASGVDIYRVTDWTRIAWAAIANATCGAFNDNGIYIGTSTSGVYRLPLAATGAATSQLVSVFITGTAVALSSSDINPPWRSSPPANLYICRTRPPTTPARPPPPPSP